MTHRQIPMYVLAQFQAFRRVQPQVYQSPYQQNQKLFRAKYAHRYMKVFLLLSLHGLQGQPLLAPCKGSLALVRRPSKSRPVFPSAKLLLHCNRLHEPRTNSSHAKASEVLQKASERLKSQGAPEPLRPFLQGEEAGFGIPNKNLNLHCMRWLRFLAFRHIQRL